MAFDSVLLGISFLNIFVLICLEKKSKRNTKNTTKKKRDTDHQQPGAAVVHACSKRTWTASCTTTNRPSKYLLYLE
jgi:hypothetical protein